MSTAGDDDVRPAGDSTARCDHGDVLFGIDPDPVYLRPCEQPYVLEVPVEDVAGPARFCSYHLARYLEDVDERLEAELVARGARDHAADPAFVTIDDAPADVEVLGETWMLHSIDQLGHAHYVRPAEAIVELLPTFEPTERSPISLDETAIERYMERLRQDRGFAGFAPGVVLPTGGRR